MLTATYLSAGNYHDYIIDHLHALGMDDSDNTIKNSLWRCTNSKSGEIAFVQMCDSGCSYGGSGKSNDYCNQSG